MIGLAMMIGIAFSAQSGGGTEYQEAFDKAFRESFRNSSIQSCVAAAKRAALLKIDMVPICTCAADRLIATKTVQELQGKLVDADVDPIIAECVKEHPPVPGSLKP